MNKIVIYIIPLFVYISFVSCRKSFLEISPKGRLIAQTANDYYLLLNNSRLSGINADAQIFLGDEVAAYEPFFQASDLRVRRLFTWSDTIYLPDQTAPELDVPLQNIYTYNKIINEVMNATGGNEEMKAGIKAEALAGRAWTYFLLINYYGKPYNAASASTDPGFPVITEADIYGSNYTRAPVQEVYDFIIKGLTDAIPLLPVQTTSRIRMSKPAAEALLGKVYVFMGKYQEALPLLNAAIADASASPIAIRLYDYNSAFSPGGAFFPRTIFGPSIPVVHNFEENLYSKTFNNFRGYVSGDILISPETAQLYGSSDLRLNFYSQTPFPTGATLPNGMLRRTNGSTASYFGMLLPDIYLLRAECKSRLDDLEGAISDVEALREKRMPPADAAVPEGIATDKTALINFIIQERIREFAVQGSRWFDMRRLSVDPLFSNNSYQHRVFAADGSVVAQYSLSSERLTLQFPPKLMQQNPGMQNNP